MSKKNEVNEIVELPSFISYTENLCVTSEYENRPDYLGESLFGKYRVFRQITMRNEDETTGSLFILHESIVDEKKEFDDYDWQESISVRSENFVVKIFNDDLSFDSAQLSEQLSDSMALVIDNIICFTMEMDYEHEYEELKQDNKIVGIKFDGLGCWLNTTNNFFINACNNGDLEKVRYYLHSPELDKHASIDARDNLGFYLACQSGNKELIKYLLSSDELTEHSKIKHLKTIDKFITFCENNWQIVQELIIELPIAKTFEIKAAIEGAFRSSNNSTYYQNILNKMSTLLELITIRENHEQLNEHLSLIATSSKVKNKI